MWVCFVCILLWVVILWGVLGQLFLLVEASTCLNIPRSVRFRLSQLCCIGHILWWCNREKVQFSFWSFCIMPWVCKGKNLQCWCTWIWCGVSILRCWEVVWRLVGQPLVCHSCQDKWLGCRSRWFECNMHPSSACGSCRLCGHRLCHPFCLLESYSCWWKRLFWLQWLGIVSPSQTNCSTRPCV